MKTCATCLHYNVGTHRGIDMCMAPQHLEDDLVRGGTFRSVQFCDTARMAFRKGVCGVEGKFWEEAAKQDKAA